VDPLRKLGGTPCVHQRLDTEEARVHGGCRIHATRPAICRAYRCLWLQGGLAEEDRPDRLGAVLDLVAVGAGARLEIREAEPGAFDASPRLQALAARYRRTVPVRITDVADPLDPDRPFRVLLPDGDEHRVHGDRTTVWRGGRRVAERRLGLPDRGLRRLLLWLRARRVRRYRGAPGHPGAPAPRG